MAKSKGLTDRQKQLVDFISHHIYVSGYAPSMQDIADHFGFRSLTTVADHLKSLERKGAINRPKGARTLTINKDFVPVSQRTRPQKEGVVVPLVGKVSAGLPVLAVENIEDYYLLDSYLARFNDVFMLRVNGDSMIDAHIMNGDLLVVHPQRDALRNDIVVAMVNDEATVKRYIPQQDCIVLKPENSSMEPIRIPRKDASFSIVGKVVGIMREC